MPFPPLSPVHTKVLLPAALLAFASLTTAGAKPDDRKICSRLVAGLMEESTPDQCNFRPVAGAKPPTATICAICTPWDTAPPRNVQQARRYYERTCRLGGHWTCGQFASLTCTR